MTTQTILPPPQRPKRRPTKRPITVRPSASSLCWAAGTRLRVTVKDPAKVADLAAWKAEGALSLLVKGDGIQAVYGPKADVLKSDINDIL